MLEHFYYSNYSSFLELIFSYYFFISLYFVSAFDSNISHEYARLANQLCYTHLNDSSPFIGHDLLWDKADLKFNPRVHWHLSSFMTAPMVIFVEPHDIIHFTRAARSAQFPFAVISRQVRMYYARENALLLKFPSGLHNYPVNSPQRWHNVRSNYDEIVPYMDSAHEEMYMPFVNELLKNPMLAGWFGANVVMMHPKWVHFVYVPMCMYL